MKKEFIDNYALYNAVIVETNDGDKFKGWLVPYQNKYMLLPVDTDIWKKYIFSASFIKEITHMTNKVSINRLVKQLEQEVKFN